MTLEDGIADGMEIKISDMVIRELCPDILLDWLILIYYLIIFIKNEGWNFWWL